MVKLLLQFAAKNYACLMCITQRSTSCILKRFLHQKIPTKYLKSYFEARSDPAIMKIDTPEFHTIFTPELKKLVSIFEKYSYEIRIAGGAVRDLLMGQTPADLDFATIATPEQMKAMFITENVRMINNRGERHGTITARIDDSMNFEVTTLRIDVLTDGRHADVEFTTDWKLDANRRDLTINAMFLGLDGTIYDYFYGYEDLKKRRIKFVGEAVQRIQEDYLRILRYFRFYGRIAESPDAHDQPTLEAIRENVSGLDRISGERIWTELSKILNGNFAGELVETMFNLGLGPHIGFPQDSDVEEFMKIWNRSKISNVKLLPPTLIAGLLRSKEEVFELSLRLKFSAFERDLIFFVVQNRTDMISVNPLRPYQAIVVHSKLKTSTAHLYCIELLKYRDQIKLAEEFEKWSCPKFPVSGNVLRTKGVPGGKPMGIVIRRLKDYWIEHDFKPTEDELLNQTPGILDELGLDPSETKKKQSSPKSA